MEIKGIITPIPTFFTENGEVDYRAMEYMVDFLIEKGVDGILFLGTAGEFAHMPFQQREDITRWAVSYVKKRVPVWIGSGANTTKEMLDLSRIADDEGADGLVIINPYYYPLGDRQLFEYFSAAAQNNDLPIMLYNFPSLTGQDLTTDFVVKLAQAHENIVGIKATVDQIGPIRELIHEIKPLRPDFAVFAGFDEYLLDTLILGGNGAIPASSNFAPELTLGIYQAFQQKDIHTIIKLVNRLAHIPYVYSLDSPYVNVVKEALRLVGMDVPTHVLQPSQPLAPEKRESLIAILKKAELI